MDVLILLPWIGQYYVGAIGFSSCPYSLYKIYRSSRFELNKHNTWHGNRAIYVRDSGILWISSPLTAAGLFLFLTGFP
jgi:hypothetical protein